MPRRTLLRLGNVTSARAALDRTGEAYASTRLLLLFAQNDSASARVAVEGLPHPSLAAVEVLAALGERERAVPMLEAIAAPTLSFYQLLQLPEMDPLRSHPRFQRIYAASLPLVPVR